MMKESAHRWELWYPDAGMTGLLFARAQIGATDTVWVHAAPETLTITVREGDEKVIARGESLERGGKRYPMTRLTVYGNQVAREDRWPTQDDLGSVVILPGGEAGRLLAWWNAADESEWRWQVEFYNHQ